MIQGEVVCSCVGFEGLVLALVKVYQNLLSHGYLPRAPCALPEPLAGI